MRLRNVKGAYEKVEASEYIIHNYKDYKGNYKKVFNNSNPICIEIGMGKGDFILGMAKKYPDINFIGIEKFDNVIIRAIEKIEKKIPNLELIKMDAECITDIFYNVPEKVAKAIITLLHECEKDDSTIVSAISER